MEINKRNSPLFASGLAKWEKFVAEYTGPYDLVGAVYSGMNHKVSFLCPTHGPMQMDAKNMMAGRKCVKCMFEERAGKPRITQRKMLEKFAEAHGNRYNYALAIYKAQQEPVSIVCQRHGKFEQKPEYHWGGSGCPKCFHEDKRGASQRDTLETFSEKLAEKFGSLLTVCESQYEGTYKPLKVLCTKHNAILETRPNYLLNGWNPCPKCNHMASKGEDEVYRFLSNLAEAEQRNRKIIAPKELDIYLPERKLAVEYCGMFWHSHGSQEEEKKDKRKHQQKYELCKSLGIRLITLWEEEWKEHNYAIRRLLRNAIGKSKGKLMARKCELKKVSNAEAKLFYERYHPQGGDGSGEHYALFWSGKMVACMRFVFGANDRGVGAANRTWTLGRYATRINVAGAASRLFKAFLDEYKPDEVKSFSDNRFFEGGMYEQLGFLMEEEVAADYQVWSPKLGMKPKTRYQRRNLQKRLDDHGLSDVYDSETDPRTEAEMTFMMGCRRIYDCGKKRWVWKKPVDPSAPT
jgi:G:T-mismatch repair DNA endonuclease (very short patch repair protein)